MSRGIHDPHDTILRTMSDRDHRVAELYHHAAGVWIDAHGPSRGRPRTPTRPTAFAG